MPLPFLYEKFERLHCPYCSCWAFGMVQIPELWWHEISSARFLRLQVMFERNALRTGKNDPSLLVVWIGPAWSVQNGMRKGAIYLTIPERSPVAATRSPVSGEQRGFRATEASLFLSFAAFSEAFEPQAPVTRDGVHHGLSAEHT